MITLKKYYSYYKSPIGCLTLVSNGEALLEADLHKDVENEIHEGFPDNIIRQAERELTEYFEGKRTEFTVPLAPQGTDFERCVWGALLKIPFGETKTYGEIAGMIGSEKASRAVGNAVGKNPVLIMIPCHRVIAAGGKLGGFSCGVDVKKKLHEIEKIVIT